LLLNRLVETIAPLSKTLTSYEIALYPKAYPVSPMILPTLEDMQWQDSAMESSPAHPKSVGKQK
jgi:hypothetical protein